MDWVMLSFIADFPTNIIFGADVMVCPPTSDFRKFTNSSSHKLYPLLKYEIYGRLAIEDLNCCFVRIHPYTF